MEPMVIGVDVSKHQLDVSTPNGVQQCPNNPEGHQQLVEQLGEWSLESIIFEATGGYERAVAAKLAAAGLPVVVNPRHVRNFARATGQLAKTDAIDAKVLEEFGRAVKPTIRELASEQQQKLQQ